MTTSLHLCSRCGGRTEHILHLDADFLLSAHNSHSDIFSCVDCGLASTQPPLSTSEIRLLYPESYEAYESRTGALALLTAAKHKGDVRRIKRYVVGSTMEASVIEIGAGRGEFLSLLDSMKWGTIEGIEPSTSGCRVAKDIYGLDLIEVDVESYNFNRKYSVVILRHVLEHLDDPIQFLRRIYDSVLDEGGILYLKVPKFNSVEFKLFRKYWHGLDLPRHRWHFRSEVLKSILEDIGYVVVFARQEVVPTDFVRSLRNLDAYADGIPQKIGSLFCRLPSILKISVSALATYLLAPGGSGRMILIAQRSSTLLTT